MGVIQGAINKALGTGAIIATGIKTKKVLEAKKIAKESMQARQMMLKEQKAKVKENNNKYLDTTIGKIDVNSDFGKKILAQMNQGVNNGK